MRGGGRGVRGGRRPRGAGAGAGGRGPGAISFAPAARASPRLARMTSTPTRGSTARSRMADPTPGGSQTTHNLQDSLMEHGHGGSSALTTLVVIVVVVGLMAYFISQLELDFGCGGCT